MKRLYLFIGIGLMTSFPVMVNAQETKIVEVKKKEEDAATKKNTQENKTIKPEFTASGKTIPPGMEVTKMVKNEFEKGGLIHTGANKIEEKKKTEQEKSAEESKTNDSKLASSTTTKSTVTNKELAEKLPDIPVKAAVNNTYSKVEELKGDGETKLYSQNNLPGNNNTTQNGYGETKLYPSQEQYQTLPKKKSNEPNNNLSAENSASQNKNALNQYDAVERPLNSSGTLPNQNQYSELKLTPRSDKVEELNQYTKPPPPNKFAAESEQDHKQQNQQAANPKPIYGGFPQSQNGNSSGALTKEMIEVRTYQPIGGTLIKEKETAETKALQSQSEKTALTKENELKETQKIKEAEDKKQKESEENKIKEEQDKKQKAAEEEKAKEAERIKEAERKAAEKKVVEERKKTVHE